MHHLELDHGFDDPSKDLTCPLCQENLVGRAKTAHLARHLEEISLTILPANAEESDDGESDEDSEEGLDNDEVTDDFEDRETAGENDGTGSAPALKTAVVSRATRRFAAEALFDFEAQETANELPLTRGERLWVFMPRDQLQNPTWIRAYSRETGRQGIVPRSYVHLDEHAVEAASRQPGSVVPRIGRRSVTADHDHLDSHNWPSSGAEPGWISDPGFAESDEPKGKAPLDPGDSASWPEGDLNWYRCGEPGCKAVFEYREDLIIHMGNHQPQRQERDATEPSPATSLTDGGIERIVRQTKEETEQNEASSERSHGNSAPTPFTARIAAAHLAATTAAAGPATHTENVGSPIERVNAIANQFNSTWRPLCIEFVTRPPLHPRDREHQHRQLSEAIMQSIVLKVDEIDTFGEPVARQRRKDIIIEVQGWLNKVDDCARGLHDK